MKAKFLSLALALIALISFGNAYAQNPHFNRQESPIITVTCITQGTNSLYQVNISGVVHGIGNAQTGKILYTYEANFECYNRGNDPGPVPGQSGPIDKSLDVTLTTIRPGVASFSTSFTIGGSCKGNALSSVVTALRFLRLELEVDGVLAKPSLKTFLPSAIATCSRP